MRKLTADLARIGSVVRIHDANVVPKKRRTVIVKYRKPKHAMHQTADFIDNAEFSNDLLMTITRNPYEVNSGRNLFPITIWLQLDNGQYFLWGNYKKANSIYDWKILYEFRRVLIEKTDCFI